MLVLGDESNWSYQFSAIYDPKSNTWSSIGRPPVPLLSTVLLGNGKVLFVSNSTPSGDTRLAELYDPALDRWAPAARMEINGVWGTATTLLGGGAVGAQRGLHVEPHTDPPRPAKWDATAHASRRSSRSGRGS